MDRRAHRSAYNAYMRAYQMEYRAERRRRGLCLRCAEISVRFVYCLACREETNALAKKRRAKRLKSISVDLAA